MATEALLLTSADVAARLSVDRSTLSRWDRAGRIGPRPLKIGGATRWCARELQAWVDAGCPGRAEWMARSSAEGVPA